MQYTHAVVRRACVGLKRPTEETKVIDAPVPDDWIPRLTAAIAAAVQELAPRLRGTPVAFLVVDCQPWHGSIGLAILTVREAEADQLLLDPMEMAAWRHYDFTAGLPSWLLAGTLGRTMQAAYEAADDRRGVAEAFFRACAEAVATPEAADALELLERASGFRISVAHPDDGREFFPPANQSAG
jgi:hypothetical protein